VLGKIMAEQRGIPESKAEDVVKSMRSANQYQVRRHKFHYPCSPGCQSRWRVQWGYPTSIPQTSLKQTNTDELLGGRLVINERANERTSGGWTGLI
jgi:hypothetical protein